uniref:Uncharacterized protein n=1 Tax=Populus alba TaxID=43335 RepID=A0A4U5Q6D2_POPAL|nr:hypothetical protein D5086_0000129580 [Populus alba]
MQVVPRESESALSVSGPRPMEWSTVPYTGSQAPGHNAGNVIASGSHDKEIFLWYMHGECKNFMVMRGHKNAVLDLHWTADGSQIISASPDKTVRAWDVETGKQIKKMAEHSSFKGAIQTFPDKYQITAVSFSDASDKIFTGGIDNDVKVWDIRKGEVTMTLEGHQDMITSMQLSPDGSYLLTNGMDTQALHLGHARPYAPQNRLCKDFEGHQQQL